MKMSTNHRWVRIPTFEVFAALLKTLNVVIAEFRTFDIVDDAESFTDLLFQGDEDSNVKILEPKLSRVFHPADLDSFYSREFAQLAYHYRLDAAHIKENGEFKPDVTHWLKTRLIEERFHLNSNSGFYLLQESVLRTDILPIVEATDVPTDGIVYFDNRPHFITQYPEGLFHLMYYDEFENKTHLVQSNLTSLEGLQVKKTYLAWQPLRIDLTTGVGLRESLKHLRETFVSISGDTPDDYFDKQNAEVI